MAKNRTIPNKIRVGFGAKFINPQWDAKKPDAFPKWVHTGTHLSRYLAEQYVKKNHPYVPAQNVRIYGIRMPARVFEQSTLAYLSRANARGFGSDSG